MSGVLFPPSPPKNNPCFCMDYFFYVNRGIRTLRGHFAWEKLPVASFSAKCCAVRYRKAKPLGGQAVKACEARLYPSLSAASEHVSLVPIFRTKNQSRTSRFLLFRKKARSAYLFRCKRLHNGTPSLTPFYECESMLLHGLFFYAIGGIRTLRGQRKSTALI